MYSRAVIAVVVACVPLLAATADAQPSPVPAVTAEAESWYLSGQPLLHDGNIYHPRGAAVHFDRDEYVRSGFYRGVPLYSRTTIEPFSIVYVPLAGGLLQPYERVRTGDVAGTVGSLAPTLPVPVPGTDRRDARGMAPSAQGTPQAAGPPTGLAGPTDIEGNPRLGVTTIPGTAAPAAPADTPRPVGTAGSAAAPAESARPVGTAGTAAGDRVVASSAGRTVVLPKPRPLATAARPTGINAMYIEFENRRWFAAGPAVELDPSTLLRVGNYHGLPVYARSEGDVLIYIPTAANVRTLLVPYAR